MLLEQLLEDFYMLLAETENSVSRQFSFPDADKMIKVAIGMRRTGKTYLLFQHIHLLLTQDVPLETILYINFEDDRLLPMNQKQMAELLESFYSLYPENHHRLCYLFLDELQNVEGWELVVRRFFDTKKVQIYLTGSSAKLLSKEIATSLRGRSIPIEIWPYNFSEYLVAHSIKKSGKLLGKVTMDIFGKHFLSFLTIGGFPAVQGSSETIHREMLQNYVETVIFRDVVERHGVTNIALLRYLTNTLLKNFATLFSTNKFFNDIKSQGHQVAKDTIYNYIDYLEDAYLIATVPIWTESLRRAQVAPKKIYGVDNGLIKANIFSQVDNLGRLLENQVYLDLRRENKKIFYYQTKSGFEIDFLTQTLTGELELIQVAWDLNDPVTREREERALQEAMDELNISGRIIDKEVYLKNFLKD
ncbi:MAG: ATP-binding protein [Gammaproteobacteria bacterium]